MLSFPIWSCTVIPITEITPLARGSTPLEVGGEVLADEHAIKASSRVANFCGKVIFLVWFGMKLCTWMVRVFAQLRSTTELGLLGEMRQLRRTRAAGYHRSFTTHDDKSHTLTLALELENQN